MTPSIKINQILEVHVDRLSVGGRGVARYDGAVIFVERAAPQETLQVRITFVKKKYAEAEIVKIIGASAARITPPCPHWSECGGCSWQHLSYAEQLKQKTLLVEESIKKFSGFVDFNVNACLPSPDEFRYRNRIQVHVQNGNLGFFKKNTHQIVSIDDCLITDKKITQRFSLLRKNSLKQKSTAAKAERLELKLDSDDLKNHEDLDFSQVNSAQNEVLRDLVCKLVKGLTAKKGSLQIFDLYCGGGNLSFPLAEHFPKSKIIGVELSAKNVAAAKAFLKSSKHQGQIEFHQAKVEDFLKKTSYDLKSNLVLLDPPRTGCDPVTMQTLAEKKPHSIIYVSCHPATLSRDLKFLANDYIISSIQPLDMFPQTDHVECIVALERAPGPE